MSGKTVFGRSLVAGDGNTTALGRDGNGDWSRSRSRKIARKRAPTSEPLTLFDVGRKKLPMRKAALRLLVVLRGFVVSELSPVAFTMSGKTAFGKSLVAGDGEYARPRSGWKWRLVALPENRPQAGSYLQAVYAQ